MLVKPAYKCLLCERLFVVGEAQDIPYDKLPDLIGSVVRNQNFAGNPYLYNAPMYIPCPCRDGNAGIAYFAGFMRKELIP